MTCEIAAVLHHWFLLRKRFCRSLTLKACSTFSIRNLSGFSRTLIGGQLVHSLLCPCLLFVCAAWEKTTTKRATSCQLLELQGSRRQNRLRNSFLFATILCRVLIQWLESGLVIEMQSLFETQSAVIPESALLISVSFLSLARIAFLKGQSHQNYGHSKNFWNLGKIDQIGIDFEIFDERNQIVVTCSSKCFGKTGIEMEALVGASIRNVFYAQFVTSKYGRPDKYVCIWTKYVFTSTRVRNPSEFAGAGAARHKLQNFWRAFNFRSL